MKKRNRSLLMMMVMMVIMVLAVFIPAKTTQAASSKSKNEAAHKAYKKKYKSIAKKYAEKFDWCSQFGVGYYYKDFTGDGLDELFVSYHDYEHGSADTVRVYTYKNKKVTCILNTAIYGIGKISYYKKGKSIIIESYGHGDEVHDYFKCSKGKYKLIAYKFRESTKGGSSKNGPWYYTNAKNKTIKSSKFKSLVKPLTKGSKKTLNYDKIKTYTYYK